MAVYFFSSSSWKGKRSLDRMIRSITHECFPHPAVKTYSYGIPNLQRKKFVWNLKTTLSLLTPLGKPRKMGIAERRLRQKEEVRSAILSTAWQMVKNEGWQSLSIRKIADAIEYSVPVIYDHFHNKEAILFEFAKEGFKLLSKRLKAAKEKCQDAGDQIKAMADAYWSFALRNKEHYQLMFGIGMATCENEKCMPEKAEFRNLLMEPIDYLLSKNKKSQSISGCLKYHTLWSVLHGLVSIKIMGNSDVSDEVNKMVLDDAIAGFIKNLKQ